MNKKYAKVGGQAVIEGVMMRSPGCLAVAVRRASGEIVVREEPWRSIWNRLRFLRWPFLRGSVVMIEAMVNGFQALNFSAREMMPEEEKQKADAGSSSWLALTMLLSVLMAVAVFKMLPHLAATYAGVLWRGSPLTVDDWGYHVVDGLVKLSIFIGYVVAIGFLKDIKRVFMYHGAEHMVIHTLEKGEPLTVENARTKSTLHPRCGTAFLMVVILVFIVVAALLMPYVPAWAKPGEGKPWFTHIWLVLLKLPLLIPVAGIAYEFNRLAGRYAESPLLRPLMWPGLLMQLLTTRRPSEDQLEIALVALNTTLWREQNKAERPQGSEIQVFESYAAFRDTLGAVQPSQAVF